MFGKRMRELRTDKDITQATLAKYMHVTQATVANYETGRKSPDFDKLKWLCEYFNVTSDYLLGFSDLRLPYKYTPAKSLTEDEQTSLEYYNRLSIEDKDYIKGQMLALNREQKEKNNKNNKIG